MTSPAPEGPGQAPKAVNLRDLGELSPALRKGVLYRCSQLYDSEVLRELKVKTVVDLRGRAEVGRNKKKHHGKHDAAPAGPAEAAHAGGLPRSSSLASVSGSESDTDASNGADGKPTGAEAGAAVAPEVLSSEALEQLRDEALRPDQGLAAATSGIQKRAEVVTMNAEHPAAVDQSAAGTATSDAVAKLTFDVIPAKEFGRAMLRMPLRVWQKALWNLATFKDPRSPFIKAFADEQLLGFTKYYILILEHSRRNLAAVMRVFTKPDAMPALIHCAHGKDRTGVVVMLLMLACGVPHESIVRDYAQSERQLQEYRASLGLTGADAAAASIARTIIPLDDAIIASTEQTMHNVLTYMEQQYVTPDNYFASLGLTPEEVERIREALMTREGLEEFRRARL